MGAFLLFIVSCLSEINQPSVRRLGSTILFTELNVVYERNDLKKVCEILNNLEKGNFFVNKSDVINEKQLMKSEIEKLRLRINELIAQCRSIQESEAYKTIINIGNWDNYFESSKQKLVKQINEFKNAK